MGTLRDTVARLAAGSRGRTEADVQADIRRFLLDARFELIGTQLVDVALEAQAGGGRRIDIEAGCAVIEVKKALSSAPAFVIAVAQLAGYVRDRTRERSQRYVGVLTDGQTWVLFHLKPDDTLAEVSRLRLAGGEDVNRLTAWLEPVLATTDRLRPTPSEIVRRLGATSAAAQLDLADLHALYDACRNQPEVHLKRQLWARLLLSALGTHFDDSDKLFVTHTYLVLTAELVAHQVMGLRVDAPDGDVRALLEGQQFAMAGLHGVVEADFFDWPLNAPSGALVIAGVARRVTTFDWSDVKRDVLKALYESIIDADTRRRLGEYYTPDWLAQKIVDEHFTDPLHTRLLDPACGSGTFLFWAVKRVLAACDAAELPNRVALARVVAQVQGMDLHPVAVTLARVTYLLALTPSRLADREELTVPVFLGDSVRWEHDGISLSANGMRVRTSDDLELVEDELHFPEGVIDEPARFDRLVADLAERASSRKGGTKAPSISGLLNRHKVVGDDDREAMNTVFRKLCRLHDAGRDHVWSYYIRNRVRPLSFARADGRADVLVGNPPWLAYRSMPNQLQRTYRRLARQRNLWAGGKVATHQDLSDLFVARSVEQYLKPGGTFAFVMPYAALSRRQFAGFRTGDWSSPSVGTCVSLEQPEDFARVKPPLFGVPSCMVSGVKSTSPVAMPRLATIWTGRVPSSHADWAAASEYLFATTGDVTTAVDSGASPYRARFRQGANLVPRVLITVEEAVSSPLGVVAGRVRVRSARSANEKHPWKELPPLEEVVERQFVRPMHLGATILAYCAQTPGRAVVPVADGRLLDGSSERMDEFPGLARWWRGAEAVWEANKTEANRLSLADQVDYQGKLRKQFPIARERVVYTKSGQHLAACRVDDDQAVIDHKLYWAAVDSATEGRYLCAVLNSQVLAHAVLALQARGQHNPRDFDMHVFTLPFPTFDSSDPLHGQLSSLAERAERIAADTEIDARWQFQKARHVVREALREEGVAAQIDQAVAELIAAAVHRDDSPPEPDVMDALSMAVAAVHAYSDEPGGRPRKRAPHPTSGATDTPRTAVSPQRQSPRP